MSNLHIHDIKVVALVNLALADSYMEITSPRRPYRSA